MACIKRKFSIFQTIFRHHHFKHQHSLSIRLDSQLLEHPKTLAIVNKNSSFMRSDAVSHIELPIVRFLLASKKKCNQHKLVKSLISEEIKFDNHMLYCKILHYQWIKIFMFLPMLAGVFKCLHPSFILAFS